MSSEFKEKEYKGPMSLEKITYHEPTDVKRDPEDIKEGIEETPKESKERLTRSDMTKGSDKACKILCIKILDI